MSGSPRDLEAGTRPAIDPLSPQTWPQAARLEPPFAKLIGAEVVSATPDRVEARLLVRPELLNRNGFLHGGAILAVADNLGGTTTFMNLAPTQTTTTIESKSNFFKAVAAGDTVRFVCEPLHKGGRTIVLQTSVYRSDGKRAAVVTQTQMILERSDPAIAR
jgi:uncharacterized protein (TIGR00369 family)